MVKVPNRMATAVEPQPLGPPPSHEACPPLTLEIAIATGVSVHDRDSVSAQLRGARVRLLSRGQILAWVDDEAAVRTIKQCYESGGRYEGHVAAVAADRAVIVLEGNG